ncbi:protein adenylyltransferase SelO family protein [Corynebacterium uterequi]|uniref:Putative ACR, YdiU/UPF0061-like family n=1 Tax=Corynebacterium uterequi TaxID=1072256 RepID=A0A0G3HF31_9CORY|nr:protein adenylyltransferase SelO family protein [Corynebacterium uterequi]AKK11340.1 putative ACR, YdiU/UPF0061-like family [Corynebacterium uterequi]
MEPCLPAFVRAVAEFALPANPEAMPRPAIVVLNEPLAVELGLSPEWLRSDDGLAYLQGRSTPTFALAYAGHQFGHYSPLLGDGRALLLDEREVAGQAIELHAKGTGPTPLSRPGSDGRGSLSSMLKEFLFSEALHALGVPTTRTLAVVATGHGVVREYGPEPAAFLVRTSAGLTRVGTYELARTHNADTLDRLLRLDSGRIAGASGPVEFFAEVVRRQGRLVGAWMRLGFIHGVMNTDNTSIAGETLDYGPCAWTPGLDPTACYSSIDAQGRYAFGNQPAILRWNLTRLAQSMAEVASVSDLVAQLAALPDHLEAGRARIDDTPRWLPLNHLVEAALAGVRHGECGPFDELAHAVTHPWEEDAGSDFTRRPAPSTDSYRTFCGT